MKDNFREILKAAIEGNKAALDRILKMYQPLINKYSYWRGQIDEDMRQYILLHIIQSISKFVI